MNKIETVATLTTSRVVKYKRRYCTIPGCGRIVKSQHLCQRHGATTKLCNVTGCPRQAQGGHRGMCKSHFKELQSSASTCMPISFHSISTNTVSYPWNSPDDAIAVSVYHAVLPATIIWTPDAGGENAGDDNNNDTNPLVEYLRKGLCPGNNQYAWHRNNERKVRGLAPVVHLAYPLDVWEWELVWTEILILTGFPDSFDHLAFGWGRPKGFEKEIIASFCQSQSRPNHNHGNEMDCQEESICINANDDTAISISESESQESIASIMRTVDGIEKDVRTEIFSNENKSNDSLLEPAPIENLEADTRHSFDFTNVDLDPNSFLW